MKYLTFVWSVSLATIIYLPLMLAIWLITGSAPSWWVAAIVISLLAFVIHLVILLRQDYQWKSADIVRTDDTVLANVETLNQYRQAAEKYILESGDEDAIKVLKEAQTHYFTYNSILLNGMKKGNDTLKIALLILAGEVDGNAVPENLNHDIDEAMRKMEAKLFPMDMKNQR